MAGRGVRRNHHVRTFNIPRKQGATKWKQVDSSFQFAQYWGTDEDEAEEENRHVRFI